MLWTMDWGWISTSILSPGKSKSRAASMTSKPLFIRVAESREIFRPMDQVGCFTASAGVMPLNSSRGRRKKGPPEAVRINFSTSSRRPFSRHWKMADCSLSTGSSSPPPCRSASFTRSPPQTRDSLLAMATRFPAFRAESRGTRAAMPEMASTTTSTWGSAASSQRAWTP